jgi:hypothetical protein
LTEEKLVLTRKLLVLGNLALLGWLFIAFFGVFFYTVLYSFLFLIIEFALVYGVLRRLGCSNCYQCKTCTSGFGRLAGVFFGTGFVKKASVGNRVGFVGFMYFLLFPLPVALLVLSFEQSFAILKVLVLVLLLAVATFSLSSWYTRSTVKS